MHLQTQPTQVFTVFGSYVLEGDREYFPLTADPVVKTARFIQQAIERKDQCHD
jgi:hypothetical protein